MRDPLQILCLTHIKKAQAQPCTLPNQSELTRLSTPARAPLWLNFTPSRAVTFLEPIVDLPRLCAPVVLGLAVRDPATSLASPYKPREGGAIFGFCSERRLLSPKCPAQYRPRYRGTQAEVRGHT